MSRELNKVTVDPDGATVDVDITLRGTRASAYTDAAGGTSISLPASISASTDFWLEESNDYRVTVSDGDTVLHAETVGLGDESRDVVVRPRLSLGEAQDLIAAGGGGGGSGTSLTTIPISTDEGDWDNSDGAWTFNEDGTVTPTVTTGVATLVVPATALGFAVAGDLIVPATATGSADVTVGLADDSNLGGSHDFGLEIAPDSGSPPGSVFPQIGQNSVSPSSYPYVDGLHRLYSIGSSGVAVANDTIQQALYTNPSLAMVAVTFVLSNNTGGTGVTIDLAGVSLKVAPIPAV